MYVDIPEFVSGYTRTTGPGAKSRREFAQEIAQAWCDGNPDLAELSEDAWLDTALNSIAPEVERYLP